MTVIFCPLATCGWWNNNPDRARRLELEERHWREHHLNRTWVRT